MSEPVALHRLAVLGARVTQPLDAHDDEHHDPRDDHRDVEDEAQEQDRHGNGQEERSGRGSGNVDPFGRALLDDRWQQLGGGEVVVIVHRLATPPQERAQGQDAPDPWPGAAQGEPEEEDRGTAGDEDGRERRAGHVDSGRRPRDDRAPATLSRSHGREAIPEPEQVEPHDPGQPDRDEGDEAAPIGGDQSAEVVGYEGVPEFLHQGSRGLPATNT